MLYRDVYEKLKNDITEGRYPAGSKLPSVKNLCDEYSVSAITIRHALDMLREDGFITRQPRIGTTVTNTRPERIATGKNLPIIAFVMTNFDDTFGTRILEGALDAAQGKAHLLLKRTHGNRKLEEATIASAKDAGAQGLILLPSNSAFIPKSVLSLISEHFPVTILDRRFEGIPVTTVASDNVRSATEATEYLFSLGHRHVAFITSNSHVSSNSDRRRGWEMAHAKDNIALDERFSFNKIESTLPGSTEPAENDVERLAEFVKDNPPISAYLVGEYNIALLLREALHQLGQSIPEDASVICFDHPDATFDNELFRFTNVSQDQNGLGRSAVLSALHQISHGPSADNTFLPSKLVLGQSTRKVLH